MTKPNSGNIPINSHEQNWPTTVAALAVGTAFFSLWFWLLPQWLGFRVKMRAQSIGVGSPPCRLCWDSQLLYVAFGILAGLDTELRRR